VARKQSPTSLPSPVIYPLNYTHIKPGLSPCLRIRRLSPSSGSSSSSSSRGGKRQSKKEEGGGEKEREEEEEGRQQ